MATYKKKGFKDKTKTQTTKHNSSTIEVFDTLDKTASKSEQWIEKNRYSLFYSLLGVVAVIFIYFGYNKYIIAPNEIKASEEIAFSIKYFNEAFEVSSGIDSLLNLGLEGADDKLGFIDIADSYKGTKTANLANYYAGISYLKMKEYDKAIEYLSKFQSDDKMLSPISIGAIGDAFSEIDQLEESLEFYELAANNNNNNFTAPLFLFKAGQIAYELKMYDKAEKLFTKIKEKYSKSDQGNNIDLYISKAKYAK